RGARPRPRPVQLPLAPYPRRNRLRRRPPASRQDRAPPRRPDPARPSLARRIQPHGVTGRPAQPGAHWISLVSGQRPLHTTASRPAASTDSTSPYTPRSLTGVTRPGVDIEQPRGARSGDG